MAEGETPAVETETVETNTPEAQTEAAETDPRVAELERKAKEAEREAIAERKKRQAAEAKVSEYEAAQLSEKEKAEALATAAGKRADEAEAKLKRLSLEAKIVAAATAANFVNPSRAIPLVGTDFDTDAEDVDDKIKDAITGLAISDAYLVKQGASATNGSTRNGPSKTAEDLARLSPEEVADMERKNPGEIDRILANT